MHLAFKKPRVRQKPPYPLPPFLSLFLFPFFFIQHGHGHGHWHDISKNQELFFFFSQARFPWAEKKQFGLWARGPLGLNWAICFKIAQVSPINKRENVLFRGIGSATAASMSNVGCVVSRNPQKGQGNGLSFGVRARFRVRGRF